MKSPRSTMVFERVPNKGIAPPKDLQETGATRWRRQARGDIDEQPPAGHVHRPRRGQLPEGDPQGLHGVGHHLLMTDGDVDVVLSVVGCGDGEQRGDRPALDELEPVVVQAPFDVLGLAEMRFDPPAQLRQPHDLRVRQRRLLLTVPLNSPSTVPPPGEGRMASCLVPTTLARILPSRTV